MFVRNNNKSHLSLHIKYKSLSLSHKVCVVESLTSTQINCFGYLWWIFICYHGNLKKIRKKLHNHAKISKLQIAIIGYNFKCINNIVILSQNKTKCLFVWPKLYSVKLHDRFKYTNFCKLVLIFPSRFIAAIKVGF